jgi:hypothetical protein
MIAGSSSALTGRDAAAIQSSAAVMPAGGVRLRVPGLNAQANSARRSTAGGNMTAARQAWMQALAILTDLRHPDAQSLRAKLQQPTDGLASRWDGSPST